MERNDRGVDKQNEGSREMVTNRNIQVFKLQLKLMES